MPGAIFDGRTLPSGSVVLSACRATELEPEYRDYSGPERRTFGLMSFFFSKLLAEERIRSRISNESLRDSIEHLYLEARGVYSPPTPQVEASPGSILSETFLNLGPEVDREPYFIVDLGDGGLGQMQAGVLQGITKGSIYRVHARPEDASAAQGPGAAAVAWLRVEEVHGPLSRVKAATGPDSKANEVDWPKGMVRGYAVESIRMPGDFLLRVKVCPPPSGASRLTGPIRRPSAGQTSREPSRVRSRNRRIRAPTGFARSRTGRNRG